MQAGSLLEGSLEREGERERGMPQDRRFDRPAPFENENEIPIYLYRSGPDPFIRRPLLTCEGGSGGAWGEGGGGTARRVKIHGAIPARETQMLTLSIIYPAACFVRRKATRTERMARNNCIPHPCPRSDSCTATFFFHSFCVFRFDSRGKQRRFPKQCRHLCPGVVV